MQGGMQRPWGACRHPAAARNCGPACQEGAPSGRGAGEVGYRRWGQSSAGAWEAGRGRVTLRTRRAGHIETGSLRDRDSSPAPGGPSAHTHTHTIGNRRDEEQH